MRPHDDPAAMTADERLREVARILAAGILRLRSRAALPADPGQHSGPKNPLESGPGCLELPAAWPCDSSPGLVNHPSLTRHAIKTKMRLAEWTRKMQTVVRSLANAVLALWVLLCVAQACTAAENPFAAHNAYPWRLYPKDRFDRALASGLKHLEVDVTFDPARQTAVVTHDAQPSGGEPTLDALLAPLWEKWAMEDSGHTLIIDFKSSNEEIVGAVTRILERHRDWLSSLEKKDHAEFRPGRITVCLTGDVAAHRLYDMRVPQGGQYLAFSDDTRCPGGWQSDPSSYVPKQPAGFVRFITLEKQNFMDRPNQTAGEHLSTDRLRRVVELADQRGYQLRVYTLNPRRKGNSWDTHVWDPCIDARVHMIATDAYEVARDYWKVRASQ
jgi:hypothetical protein